MGEIINLGNLILCFYCISFCSREINIENYRIQFFENLTVRSQECHLFEISENNTVKCVSSQFATVHF